MKGRIHYYAYAIMLIVVSLANASIITIEATDSAGVRTINGLYGVLDGLVIKIGSNYEDQTFLEYDISGLSLTADDIVTLDIVGLRNFDYDDPAGVVDVYSYYGDGEVTVDDFDAGTYLRSFEAAGEMVPIDLGWMITYDYYTDISIDVTALILDAINAGESYIGFRLSTLTSDRYDLGANLLPIPVLTIVPEPGTMVLLGLGGLVLRRCRR